MKSLNIRCEDFKQRLITDVNECNLPISSAFYIFQSIFQDLEKTYYATLNEEAQMNEEEEKEITEDGIKE